MTSNQDYNQTILKTILCNEMKSLSDSLHDYFKSNGVSYQLRKQRGTKIKLGDIKFYDNHYDVKILSSYDGEEIQIEQILVNKNTKQLVGDYPGSHMIQKYDEAVERLKQKYNVPLEEYEAQLEDLAGKLINIEITKEAGKYINFNTCKNLPDSYPHYISKIASLYTDKLSEKLSQLAYYSTSFMKK